MIPNKACPVLMRTKNDEIQILVFRHPLTGIQLIKGTIEPEEVVESTVLRELFEESGIDSAVIVEDLGIWNSGYDGQVWAIYLCETEDNLPDSWIHHTQDDGGQNFTFFWHSLKADSSDWHPLYRDGLQWVKTKFLPID
jgi:8-oxo-dGTP pyrophosphatase MutT (NUDIX family)